MLQVAWSVFIAKTMTEWESLHLLQHLKSELIHAEEQICVLRQELEMAKDDGVTVGELRAALDLERSRSSQFSDVIMQLRSDLASEKARSDELTR